MEIMISVIKSFQLENPIKNALYVDVVESPFSHGRVYI